VCSTSNRTLLPSPCLLAERAKQHKGAAANALAVALKHAVAAVRNTPPSAAPEGDKLASQKDSRRLFIRLQGKPCTLQEHSGKPLDARLG
jgi:hypothetical protein